MVRGGVRSISVTLVCGCLMACVSSAPPAAAPPAAAAPSAAAPPAAAAPFAAAPPAATEPPATDPPAAEPPAAEVPPEAPATAVVSVRNIGLHIGGGPNDAQTKAPFLKALAAAFPEFERCGALAPDGKREGTFGIDLLVPKDGGPAQTSNARTAIGSDEFRACVVKAFEAVSFPRPARGATKLSYALRFSPRK
jgi:hypothetical protein